MVLETTRRKIMFFNSHQIGDLCHTRGLLNWVVNNVDDTVEVWMGHHKINNVCINNKIQKFVLDSYDETHYSNSFGWILHRNDSNQFYLISNGDVIINTWIAITPSFQFYGLCAETVHEQAIDIIDFINTNLNQNIPYPNVVDILPNSAESLSNKHQADKLLGDISHYRKKILICNGVVHSNQAQQTSLSDTICDLVNSNKDCAFIYTAKDKSNKVDNEYFIDDYIDLPNIDEIVYVSTKSDVIVSRMSGPGSCVCVKENFFNPNLSFIALTYDEKLAHFYKNGTCKYDWTNDFSDESIKSIIAKHIV